MGSSSPDDLASRLDRLQQELAELRRRLVALERMVGTDAEHAGDREVVRSKVSYDWQS